MNHVGYYTSLALKADGTLGRNTYGASSVLAGLSNVIGITSGGNHMALVSK